VVVAAGAETVSLLSSFIRVPIEPERRRLAYSAPVTPGQFAPLIVDLEGGFAIKQLTSGVFYMGWLGEDAHADDLTFTEETLTRGEKLLPQLATVPVARVMGGIYDNTPDHRPLLGAVDGLDGLWLAAGFSGHGFMIAPAAAEIVARAICGHRTTLPADAFALRRFTSQRAGEGLFI
jgi:sarcosine oxidase subunit beta